MRAEAVPGFLDWFEEALRHSDDRYGMPKSAALTKGRAAIRGFTVVSMPAHLLLERPLYRGRLAQRSQGNAFSNPNFPEHQCGYGVGRRAVNDRN